LCLILVSLKREIQVNPNLKILFNFVFLRIGLWVKGLVVELALFHAQNTWKSKEKKVQTVKLAAYYNYLSEKELSYGIS